MVEPSRPWTVSPACRYCGRQDERIVIHGSLVCSCGAVLEEVFAEAVDYVGWGISSGRDAGREGQINTWLAIAKKGGKGQEVSAARKFMAGRVRESEQKTFVRALLARLSGQASTKHPYMQRVLDLHHQLKLVSARPRGQMPKAVADLKWSRLDAPEQGHAALSACVYLVFRESDRQRDISSRYCYSMQLISSCAQVPFRRVLRWFKGITHAFPDRMDDIRADEPLLHVDQIVSWFGSQASIDPRAPSSSCRKLPSDPALSRSVLLSGPQLRLLRTITDQSQLRDLARSLTDQLLSSEPLHSAVFGSPKTRIEPGEWAYFMVLWAMAGLLQQRMTGKDWIRRDLVQASLSGALTSAKAEANIKKKASGSDVEDESGEESEESSDLQDLPASHISQYAQIGHVIAERVRKLPWITTLPKGGNRRKKTSGKGTGEAHKVLEGDETRYIQALGDFGIELSRRRAGWAHEGSGEEPSMIDADEQQMRNEHCVCSEPHFHSSSIAREASHYSQAGTVRADRSLPLPCLPSDDDQLQAAVTYLAATSSTDSTDERQHVPLNDGNDDGKEASWTSLHHRLLLGKASLIDTMSDDVVDALLFGPGEMESYLRPRRERALVENIRTVGGDWQTEGSHPCADERMARESSEGGAIAVAVNVQRSQSP